MKYISKLYGIECEVKGRENLESEESYILVANHQSSIDCLGKVYGCWYQIQ